MESRDEESYGHALGLGGEIGIERKAVVAFGVRKVVCADKPFWESSVGIREADVDLVAGVARGRRLRRRYVWWFDKSQRLELGRGLVP
jgi:hypothetical protein